MVVLMAMATAGSCWTLLLSHRVLCKPECLRLSPGDLGQMGVGETLASPCSPEARQTAGFLPMSVGPAGDFGPVVGLSLGFLICHQGVVTQQAWRGERTSRTNSSLQCAGGGRLGKRVFRAHCVSSWKLLRQRREAEGVGRDPPPGGSQGNTASCLLHGSFVTVGLTLPTCVMGAMRFLQAHAGGVGGVLGEPCPPRCRGHGQHRCVGAQRAFPGGRSVWGQCTQTFQGWPLRGAVGPIYVSMQILAAFFQKHAPPPSVSEELPNARLQGPVGRFVEERD